MAYELPKAPSVIAKNPLFSLAVCRQLAVEWCACWLNPIQARDRGRCVRMSLSSQQKSTGASQIWQGVTRDKSTARPHLLVLPAPQDLPQQGGGPSRTLEADTNPGRTLLDTQSRPTPSRDGSRCCESHGHCCTRRWAFSEKFNGRVLAASPVHDILYCLRSNGLCVLCFRIFLAWSIESLFLTYMHEPHSLHYDVKYTTKKPIQLPTTPMAE